MCNRNQSAEQCYLASLYSHGAVLTLQLYRSNVGGESHAMDAWLGELPINPATAVETTFNDLVMVQFS